MVAIGPESDLDNMEKHAVYWVWKVSLFKVSEHGVWMYLFMDGSSGRMNSLPTVKETLYIIFKFASPPRRRVFVHIDTSSAHIFVPHPQPIGSPVNTKVYVRSHRNTSRRKPPTLVHGTSLKDHKVPSTSPCPRQDYTQKATPSAISSCWRSYSPLSTGVT